MSKAWRDYPSHMDRSEGSNYDITAVMQRIATAITRSDRIVVLSGAGISTESGIPDFRGPDGVWTKNPGAERKATIQNFVTDQNYRIQSWKNRILNSETPKPNRAHFALVDLEKKGKLSTLITQNIDSLHLQAGTNIERLIEIHGTTRDFICLECSDRGPIEEVLLRVEKGEDDPVCKKCGGILKSATISFGQSLNSEDIDRANTATRECDLFIAIGTSLTVYPVAALPQIALQSGAGLIILNDGDTPYDGLATEKIAAKIGDVLPSIVNLI